MESNTSIKHHTLTSDTYKDIDSITKGELMERLERDFPAPLVEFKGSQLNYTDRAKIIITVAKWLGLDLDNEQFMFVMVENSRLLCEAGAGSGKTTVSQLRLIKEKMFYGKQDHQILSLAYNAHAALDMEEKHSQMADTIRGKGIKGIEITSGIRARTFHSMALSWIKDYPEEFGIKYKAQVEKRNTDGSSSYGREDNEWLLSDKDVYTGYDSSFKAMTRLFGFDRDIHRSQLYKIKELNSFIGETMTPETEWYDLPQLKDLKLPRISREFFDKNEEYRNIDYTSEKVLILSQLYKAFDKYKSMKKKIEFTDVISKFTKKLYEDEEFRARVHMAYPVILVDEYQDFTKVMTTALQLMVTENTKLIAIGDGDQSIYGFRGTDPFNCLKFKKDYTEDLDGFKHSPVVTTLGTNRRCDKEIVLVAKRIIESNILRYDKEIKTFKEDGVVHNKLFNSTTEQAKYIVSKIENKSIEQLNETCISYRNRETSMIAGRILFENHIPFRVGSGFTPFEDRLTTDFLDALYFLIYPDNATRQKEFLWKLLPQITMYDVQRIVGENPDEYNKKMFWELDLSKFHNTNGFLTTLTTLQSLSQKIREDRSLTEIVPSLFGFYKMYYWDMNKKNRAFPEELEAQVYEYFNCNSTISELIDDHTERVQRLGAMLKNKQGVYLTTFHGLKGLEYDEHFIMDLEDSIFPGLEREVASGVTDEQLQILKEESVRLLYVAVTRARHSLHLMWDASNPSEFQSLVMEDKKVTQEHIEKALGSEVLTNLKSKVKEEVNEQVESFEESKGRLEPLPLIEFLPLLTEELESLPPLEEIDFKLLEPIDFEELEELTDEGLTSETIHSIPVINGVKTFCEVCLNEQYPTPSGLVCKEGHGGADSLSLEEVNQRRFKLLDDKGSEPEKVKPVEVVTPKQSKLNNILKGIKKLS